jgi:hypothetical protein
MKVLFIEVSSIGPSKFLYLAGSFPILVKTWSQRKSNGLIMWQLASFVTSQMKIDFKENTYGDVKYEVLLK